MSVNSFLEELASSLVLSDFEKTGITTSINVIKYRLKSYFQDSIVDIVLFGSYTRGTILPRRYDENSDIDVMVIFKNDQFYKPQTFLNRLKSFAEYWYARSEIHQSSPTIVLELNHIKFELVPAYNNEYLNTLYIPWGPSDWMITNPNSFNTLLTKANSQNFSKIKTSVRLIKLLNINRNSSIFKSFYLESTIAQSCQYPIPGCLNQTGYLCYLLQQLTWLLQGRCATTINCIIREIYSAVSSENTGNGEIALNKIKNTFRI